MALHFSFLPFQVVDMPLSCFVIDLEELKIRGSSRLCLNIKTASEKEQSLKFHNALRITLPTSLLLPSIILREIITYCIRSLIKSFSKLFTNIQLGLTKEIIVFHLSKQRGITDRDLIQDKPMSQPEPVYLFLTAMLPGAHLVALSDLPH